MKLKSTFIVLITIILPIFSVAQSAKQGRKGKGLDVAFINKETEKQVDVMIDGKLFTSYCWYDNMTKPVLYPMFTSAGTEITRGFPLKPRDGERNDHPHQIGMWLTYGNVNGYDFWGNGSGGLGTKNKNGGVIIHQAVEKMTGGIGEGVMSVKAKWNDPEGNELLAEKTEFHFVANGATRIIDRITTLTATGNTVIFKDTKEGMFGIRVARQLELPSKDNVTLTDASGNPTLVKALSNEGVTGNYKSSEGITGDAVWGTRAKWMDLSGSIGNEKIAMVICDHPKNISYPTYWHSRGYGLFAANPLGVKDFTKGSSTLDYTLSAGESLTFRYRVIIGSGAHLNEAEINAFAEEFAKNIDLSY